MVTKTGKLQHHVYVSATWDVHDHSLDHVLEGQLAHRWVQPHGVGEGEVEQVGGLAGPQCI
jgi:hypothetical protein